MTDEPSQTLFHPFRSGLVDLPGAAQTALFLNARPGFRLPEGFDAELTCVQCFRPDFLGLERQGLRVVAEQPSGSFELVLVQLGRHRGQNEALIGAALQALEPNGLLVAGGAKTEGADSLRKQVSSWLPLEGHAAKHHGVVFWAKRPENLPANNGLNPAYSVFDADGLSYRTLPGMFSHGEADAASCLLADNLPRDLKGSAADFCAGWGYLARRLLNSYPQITEVDLYEADKPSLDAARLNLGSLDSKIGFFWQDLIREDVLKRYDVIVMNPPFHGSGHKADSGIGAAVIKAAAKALKPKGRLFMVANRGLPYEATLSESFAQTGEIVRDARFKVLSGQGPRAVRSR